MCLIYTFQRVERIQEYSIVLSVFFICFNISLIFAQGISYAEYNYLIKKEIKNPAYWSDLQQVHESIISGEYQKSLDLLKKHRTRTEILPAIRTYLSNIEYIKGNYKVSLELCDSVLNQLHHDQHNVFYIRALYYKAKSLSALGDNSLAIELVEKGIKLSESIQNYFMLAAGYYYHGVFSSEIGKFNESVRYLQKSKSISEKLGDKVGTAASLSFLGLSNSHIGRYIEAIDQLNKSISIRLEIGDKRGLANSYLNMNKIYSELDDREKRLEYEEKSLSICQEINDQQCISGRLTNIGDIYFLEGNYVKALNYQRRALQIAKKLKIKYRIAEIHYHFAQIYTAQLDFRKASSHIDTCIQYREESQNIDGIAQALILKAHILTGNNSLSSARESAQSALEMAEEFNLIHIVRDANKILSDIFEQKEDFPRALYHLRKFQLVKDSLFNVEKSKILIKKDLESKYQLNELTAKKREALKDLEFRNQKERMAQLIWIAVLVIISLSIVVYLIYNKYQSQREINLISTKNQYLNSQVINLEKQAIFSQTIATVAHELNTPLGVITAGSHEQQKIFDSIFEKTKESLSEAEKEWIDFVISKDIFLDRTSSGFEKRKRASKIYEIVSNNVDWAREITVSYSLLLAEWNLNQDLLQEIIDDVVSQNVSRNAIDVMDTRLKNKDLAQALNESIYSAGEVVKELKELSVNQFSSFQPIEFSILTALQKIFEIKAFNVSTNISVDILFDNSKTLILDEKLFFQTAGLIIQNMLEELTNSKSSPRIWIEFKQNDEFDELSFSNNGNKIPEHIIHQIFDCFFTTKNKDEHRGLGLSIAKNNMESFGGEVLVSSDQNQTKFTLLFRKVKPVFSKDNVSNEYLSEVY
jgi:tetratricopeptide (TPR) repeat protein